MAALIFILLTVLSYLLGCFSTAKVLVKTFRSVNIYKIGTGHPDTQNIFNNLDKNLGILTGIIDVAKVYFFLVIVDFVLHNNLITTSFPYLESISTQNHLLVIGFAMIVGHCLPVTHGFKGGRGIFTYIGFVSFFAPWPMLIVGILALLVVLFFNQIRFAQYMIVLLPPFVNFFFPGGKQFLGKMFIAAILMGIINYFVSKKLGEI